MSPRVNASVDDDDRSFDDPDMEDGFLYDDPDIDVLDVNISLTIDNHQIEADNDELSDIIIGRREREQIEELELYLESFTSNPEPPQMIDQNHRWSMSDRSDE